MDIAVVLLLVLLNGSLYGFGAAIQNMSEASLEKDAENRNKTAGKLKEIMGRPAGFIYTVQIATYLGGIITGAVLLGRFGLRPETFGAGAAALVAMVSFGAVIPKRCAVKHPERWAYMTYPLVRAVSIPLKPFAWLAAGLSWAVLKCFGVELKRQEEDVTEEEIMLMVNEGQEKGVLEASEAEMITNIFELDNKQAGDIMTHRTAVKALDGDMTFKEAEQYVVNEAGNSRYPVYGEDIDDIIGVLNTRDFLLNAQLDEPKSLRELLRPAYLVPETVPADTLFSNMQKQKKHLAIVVDEYGGMSGIVTMEDLLEEIVGNIYDEFDPSEDAEIEKLGDNLWRVTGTVDLETLAEALDVDLPLDEEYDTLGGMVFSSFDSIPEDGSTPEVTMHGLHIQVESIVDHRVEKALVSKVAPEAPDEGEPDKADTKEADKADERNAE